MSEVAGTHTFSYAVSESFCNKEQLGHEKGTWRNKENQTIDDLFEDIRNGYATTAYLALNATDLPEYIAQHGMPNPMLGPYRRTYEGNSERCNENASPDKLLNFDLDGDCTIEKAQTLPTVQMLALGLSTSASHEKKATDAPSNHRLRLHYATEFSLATFFDDPTYSDPLWQWKAVRFEIKAGILTDLGVDRLVDECGDDAGRIWYGNTGPSQIIGGPKGQGISAGQSIQVKLNNVIPHEFVKAAIAKWEEHFKRSPEEIAKSQQFEARLEAGEFASGTPQQLKVAAYLLSNCILSNERATDYDPWYLVARVCKKLDPTGAVLVEPFLKFCQQSNDPGNAETLDTVWALWDRLPDPEGTRAGITSLKDAADIDMPGWRDKCPLFGAGLEARSTVCYLTMSQSNLTTGYLNYLDTLNKTAVKAQPVQTTLQDFDGNNIDPNGYLTPTTSSRGTDNGDF
jgi:hypothetical protein